MCLNLIFHPFKVHQPRPNHIKHLIRCIFKGLTMKSFHIGAIFLLNSNIKLFNLVNCSILRLVFHSHWKNRNYFVSDVELRSWHFWLVNWQQLFWKQVKKNDTVKLLRTLLMVCFCCCWINFNCCCKCLGIGFLKFKFLLSLSIHSLFLLFKTEVLEYNWTSNWS